MTIASLRDRNRERTRSEIGRIAFEQFIERGYDDVSTEEISALAGVSPRTFFRYFPTKEDVLLTFIDEAGLRLTSALRDARADLPPAGALRAAFRAASSGATNASLARRSVLITDLAQGSARLRAGMAERQRRWARAMAEVLATRMGVHVDTDPRPLVWTSTVLAAAMAYQEWVLLAGPGASRRFSIDDILGTLTALIENDSQ